VTSVNLYDVIQSFLLLYMKNRQKHHKSNILWGQIKSIKSNVFL